MLRRVLAGVAAALGALALGAAPPARAVDLESLGIDLSDLGGLFQKRGDLFSVAERVLQQELPRRVAPARRYDVRLQREGSDLLAGRLRGVDVTGHDVRTDDGLVISRLGLQMEDVRLALGSRSLESVGKSLLSVSLGEDAVSRYVQKRAGAGVRDVSVAFRNGEIEVRATPELLGIPMRSEVAGKPVFNGKDAVDFRASRVAVLGLRLPDFAVDALERKVNPVVDLSGLRLPVRLTSVKVQGDRLVADGTAFFGRSGAAGEGSGRVSRKADRRRR